MTTTKRDLAKVVTRKAGVPSRAAYRAVMATLDGIAEGVRDGRRVELRGFGVFEVVQRPARTGRHPGTGEKIRIPARRVGRFRPTFTPGR